MATKSNKHANAEQKYYGDFSGGLNLSLPAEGLAANEMQLCENFEYDPKTGALKLRAGLVLMGYSAFAGEGYGAGGGDGRGAGAL